MISENLFMNLLGHKNRVNSICFSSDAKRLVSGSTEEKAIKIWCI